MATGLAEPYSRGRKRTTEVGESLRDQTRRGPGGRQNIPAQGAGTGHDLGEFQEQVRPRGWQTRTGDAADQGRGQWRRLGSYSEGGGEPRVWVREKRGYRFE